MKAVGERKKSGLKLPDAIILATANCEGCILASRNAKDFDKRGPRVRFPHFLVTLCQKQLFLIPVHRSGRGPRNRDFSRFDIAEQWHTFVIQCPF